MGEIDFTNIIIDDFRKGKHNPFNKYVYILTHVHTDHLRGLSNSWNYGPIYCSRLTAFLILNKFPDLKALIKIVPLQQPVQIQLNDQLYATITLFDANHCAGAVLVLLEGYFGRFLYSGDFRFDLNKFKSYSYLYPPELLNDKFQKCSKQIDKLWLDNTFCNPKFTFPAQADVFKIIEDFISENLGKRIYVGMDYYGKEEALVHISKTFDTLIVVDEQRYETIITMEFDRECFTTNPDEGLIQVVPRKILHDKLIADPESLGMVMSGWANTMVWKNVKGEKDKKRIYFVPYSLHSNYQEIINFVKSIQPSFIDPVVPLDEKPSESIASVGLSMYSTEDNAESFRNIVSKYTSPVTPQYQRNLEDLEFQIVLKKKLGLDRKTAQINKTELGLNTVFMPAKGRGYKLNHERNEEQIEKVKEELRKMKEKKNSRNVKNVKNGNKVCEIVISEDEDIDEENDDVQIIEQVPNSDEIQVISNPDKKKDDAENNKDGKEEKDQKDKYQIWEEKDEKINAGADEIFESEEVIEQKAVRREKENDDNNENKRKSKAKSNQQKLGKKRTREEKQEQQIKEGKSSKESKEVKEVKEVKKRTKITRPDLNAMMRKPIVDQVEQKDEQSIEQIKKLLETINSAVKIINMLKENQS